MKRPWRPVVVAHAQTADIWTMDTTRGVTSRFTLDPGAERFPCGRQMAPASPFIAT
jgi:hypothetical protein